MSSSKTNEIAIEVPKVIRLYKDGSVERLLGTPYVPPSLNEEPQSKDIFISPNPKIYARLYLPKPTKPTTKLPMVVYFHGGGFCVESAFSFLDHRYVKSLVLESHVLVVSVEYRQAPENPFPTAYEDCWKALQWVASHSVKNMGEPWILDHGDFDRFFIGGDCSGANIAHNMALRAGSENLAGNVRILGAFLGQPYFWGSKPIGNEPTEDHDKKLQSLIWDFAYPTAPLGFDNPMINQATLDNLSKLGCLRLLVCVAGKDDLRERGVRYFGMVKESGWEGELEELFEVEGETHYFHLKNPNFENSQIMIKRLASFLNKHVGKSPGLADLPRDAF